MQAAFDTGIADNDNITNATRPVFTLSGLAPAGNSSIDLYHRRENSPVDPDSELLLSHALNQQENDVITIPNSLALSEDVYTFWYQVVDIAGNVSLSSENLTLTGSGSINASRPGTSASINLLSLSISNGAGASAGSVSNYTLTGGSHFIKLLHKFNSVQRIRNIINSGFAGKSVVRTPSRTTHRRVPAIAERISISTPDQSISVSPCVLKNGYCN